MIGEVIIENGQKKIVALTADTGTGAPVGSYLYMEKKSNPSGYLYCDGSTFDETKYPALYQYLGTNVLPDWRELGAKGAEKNTTLIFDSTETNPSTGQAGTQNHDVFAEGEFKDDQLQDHKHKYYMNNGPLTENGFSASFIWGATDLTGSVFTAEATRRKGTVTRGKSRAVFIYIKATSGLTENQQENVLNTINENLSYSTEEHKTGRKWIDGKDIYESTFDITANVNTVTSITLPFQVDTPIKLEGMVLRDTSGAKVWYPLSQWESNTYHTGVQYQRDSATVNRLNVAVYFADAISSTTIANVSFFYTKTTD